MQVSAASDAGSFDIHALSHGNIQWMGSILFDCQGTGRLMLDAITRNDVPVVPGVTLLAAAGYAVVNLAVDLINRWIDSHRSRIRKAQ